MAFNVRNSVSALDVLSNSSVYVFAENEGLSRAESASWGPVSSGFGAGAEAAAAGFVVGSVAWRL